MIRPNTPRWTSLEEFIGKSYRSGAEPKYIDATEDSLGYPLPSEFKQILLLNDGFTPKYNNYPFYSDKQYKYNIGFGPIGGMGRRFFKEYFLGYDWPDDRELWPEGVLIIGEASNTDRIGLDYRGLQQGQEPAVLYITDEDGIQGVEPDERAEDYAVYHLEANFSTFIRKLVTDEEIKDIEREAATQP